MRVVRTCRVVPTKKCELSRGANQKVRTCRVVQNIKLFMRRSDNCNFGHRL